VLDTSFVGDDAPVPFGDRPQVRAALSSPDAETLIDTFAVICHEVKDRTCAIHQVLATAAVVDARRPTCSPRFAGRHTPVGPVSWAPSAGWTPSTLR
jgi:hypothetical protein